MANNDDYEKKLEAFGQSNYGQRLLSASRPAKIISPVDRRLNFSNMRNYHENAVEKEPITEEPETDLETPNNFPERDNEQEIKSSSGNNNGSKTSNLLKRIVNGDKKKDAVAAITKFKNIKIYLICGGVLILLFFLIILFFAVFSGGGSEMTGGSFNEVSEYELNNDDEEYNEEYDEEYNEEWGQE